MSIKSILIANRGEIAVRVIRACREMNIRTVAVYSEADFASPHVRFADEAYCIGPAESSESYLRTDKILHAAREAGCDAIHPGYGFLSENAEFARAVKEEGMIFIGPPAEAITTMGDKTSARSLMISRGVPVVPGTEDAIQSLEQALETSAEIGYPVLLKAAAGGGGKGMRVVQHPDDLERSLESAQNEARTAFGDDRVYIEKFVFEPRHIEIQILADAHGNIVHLGERECSIQRRHQKVVEESPSPVVDEAMRNRMGDAAIEAARACGYENAGTIEFLVDAEMEFYFLEMNTRLQVEHPVTEMVTGIDLVKMQIRIAQGEKLPFQQSDIVFRGHAIESRLCAEDVRNNFLPSTGRITAYRPSQGFGIREDSGIGEGGEISIHYDPMFAKLIAWGMNREDAIGKMKRALDDYRIAGVETTIPFCRFVMDHPNFVSGDFNNDFVNLHYKPEYLIGAEDHETLVAALTAVALSEAVNVSGYREAGERNSGERNSTQWNNHNGNDRPPCSEWVLRGRMGEQRR